MVEPLRHRQTKGAETDMPGLPLPRHIPTLPANLSAGCGFSKQTLAGARGNDEVAPIPAVRVATTHRVKSTRRGRKTSPWGTTYSAPRAAF
jgi:hypothetical protein